MAQRLTDRNVKALKPPGGKYKITYDTEVPGFGIRVTKGGVKSFVFNYATHGRERRYTIGTYPAWAEDHEKDDELLGESGGARGKKDSADSPAPVRSALPTSRHGSQN